MNKKALIAEFIGTFTLIFIGVGSIVADYLSGGKVGLTGIALAHGLAIGVMVSATAAVSGGHLNPAVTIGLWSAKKIDTKNAICYVIAQCLGAIFACIFDHAMRSDGCLEQLSAWEHLPWEWNYPTDGFCH